MRYQMFLLIAVLVGCQAAGDKRWESPSVQFSAWHRDPELRQLFQDTDLAIDEKNGKTLGSIFARINQRRLELESPIHGFFEQKSTEDILDFLELAGSSGHGSEMQKAADMALSVLERRGEGVVLAVITRLQPRKVPPDPILIEVLVRIRGKRALAYLLDGAANGPYSHIYVQALQRAPDPGSISVLSRLLSAMGKQLAEIPRNSSRPQYPEYNIVRAIASIRCPEAVDVLVQGYRLYPAMRFCIASALRRLDDPNLASFFEDIVREALTSNENDEALSSVGVFVAVGALATIGTQESVKVLEQFAGNRPSPGACGALARLKSRHRQ